MYKIFKGILKSKVWLIVSTTILALIVAISVTLTQNMYLYNTINSVLGGERYQLSSGDPSKYNYYKSDYKNKEEAYKAANAFNETIVEEGITLLKNENNFLPLKTPVSDNNITKKPKVSVFGKNSVDLVYGGSGSSQGDAKGSVTMKESLSKAGYEVNPVLTSFYENDSQSGAGRPKSPDMGNILTGFPIGETPISSYSGEVKNSYSEYNDAAIVVISRIGGEGYDLPRSMFWYGSGYTKWSNKGKDPTPVPGARNVYDHYLQLDQNETDMIKEVSQLFENVVVIINCSQAMELGFLDDPANAYSDKIKAVVWIGGTGKSGLYALGSVLNGKVNPSGRTVDTYSRDFKKDPTWANFGNNISGFGNQYMVVNDKQTDMLKGNYFVDYEEGIYVGYRYYETRGYTDGEEWYNESVVYPFGYGLSYSSYSYEIINKEEIAKSQLTAKNDITVKIKVTNTGSVAGKEVVQLYMTAPYTAGKIEKSHVVLVGYEKTPILYPKGQANKDKPNSSEVEIKVPSNYFASYDYNDANENNFKGYEIESGRYELKASKNSHTAIDSVSFTQNDLVKIDTDKATDYKIENRFDKVSKNIKKYLSRNNWVDTFPTVPTDEDRRTTMAFLDEMDYKQDDENKPWQVDEMPAQSKTKLSDRKSKVKLYDLIGKEYNDPLWDKLMDQLTVKQMSDFVGTGIYCTTPISNISKPRTISADGPVGFTAFMGDPAVYGTCFYASGCVVAATYNKELVEEMGVMMGNEAVIGDEKGGSGSYSSWYAPAVNIHRSAFGGRNWEYYSEDGLLSGTIGASIIKGVKTKGVATYVKHFALNDQETRRCDGVSTWANEQSMREIYLRSFEICIKDGKSTGVMSSFNRIGSEWAGGSYDLLTEVLRNEWGFKGSVITDFNLYQHMPADQMIRAGGDLNLSQDKRPSTINSPTQVAAIRKSAKNVLYTLANSNAMNGYGEGVVYKNNNPIWVNILLIADAVVVVSLTAWGIFAVRKTMRKQAKKEN